MSITACPLLSALLKELQGLANPPEAQPARRRSFTLSPGRDLLRISWPGLADYWLNDPQRRVVASLLDAYLNCQSPDVPESVLVANSGAKVSHLREVFTRHAAWDALILPGRSAGTYRLAEMTEEPAEPGITREPVE